MPAWPTGLPQSQFQGMTDRHQSARLRSPVDQGPAIQRRRFTAVAREVSTRLVLTGAQLAVFDAFYVTTLQHGALSFTWVDPRTDAAASFRFKEEPEWTLRRGGQSPANRIWETTLSLEVLP